MSVRDKRPVDSLPVLLDGTGIAQHLGITERHVRRLVSERRIPFVKVGRFVRFDPVAIAGWLERTAVKASR
ncbi:MAG: helix-turn-helix domain-containing protein [Acidimicrobiales bacterium]